MNKSSARLHAVAAAYMSISTGVTGIALGLVAANAEFSMSLYGMAIVGAVDVSASCFVLLVYQATCADAYFEVDNPHRKRKETLYSYFIGGLMAMMGTFLAIDR